MTVFGSLYYTDCRPGEGLQGGAGFQFQAATPGIATEAMPLAQRAVLYEPPAAWMRDRRPVEEFPPSLAHACEDGLFVTAAGRYLGKEANGTRQGNQFTHAVVTRDPAGYGADRPAQLWGAPGWAGSAATGTELPGTDEPPAGGPLDTETVRERVGASPGGEPALLALVSAVERLADPDTRRGVVLVGPDPELAACWIAAATLLLPRPQALRTSFKIFVADPQYGRHDIVALHPEWAGRWADTGSGSGLVVLDLDRGRHTAVEPTESAAFWVPRFLREDPYDVVDAVEVAGQFARGRADGGPAGAADRSVALVVTGRRPLRSPSELAEAADWLRDAPEDAIRIARDTVLDAVLAGRPDAPVLRALAAAAGERGWDQNLLQAVQAGLLDAECAELDAAPDGVSALTAVAALEPLRLPSRSEPDRLARGDLLADRLRSAPPDRVPALVVLARRHGIRLGPDQLAGPAAPCAAWWVDRPEPALRPDGWDAPAELVAAARTELRARLAGPGAAQAHDLVRQRWWEPLWRDARHPTDPLDAALWGAAHDHLPREEQRRLVELVLDRCATARGLGDPGAAAWRILYGHDVPDPAGAVRFVQAQDRLGLGIGREVGDGLSAVVERERELTDSVLWIADRIAAAGHARSRRVRALHEEDDTVLLLAEDLRAARDDGAGRGAAAVRVAMPSRSTPDPLGGVGAAVLGIRLRLLVDALLVAPAQRAADVVLGTAHASAVLLYKELERLLAAPDTAARDRARAAALAYLLGSAEPVSEQQGRDLARLRNNAAHHVAGLSKEERVAVDRSYPGGLGEDFWTWVRVHEPSRLRRGLGRLSGALPGKPGKREG